MARIPVTAHFGSLALDKNGQASVEGVNWPNELKCAYVPFGISADFGKSELSIAHSVMSREGDVHAEAGSNVSAQTPDGEPVFDESTYTRNGFFVGAEILRRELVHVDAIRPIG